jgi:hypothetical protein
VVSLTSLLTGAWARNPTGEDAAVEELQSIIETWRTRRHRRGALRAFALRLDFSEISASRS